MSAAPGRVAALGIRMADAVTALPVREGLRAWATPLADDRVRVAGELGPSGQIVWSRLPGVDAWGLDTARSRRRRFRLEVEDRLGRYLPVQLEVEAPSDGLVTWSWGSKKERRALVPMAHQPSGPPMEGYASIYAELWDLKARRPASWSLLSARAGTGASAVTSWGLADQRGRVRVLLPWPEHALSAGRPLAEATWSISLRVRHPPQVPDLRPPTLDAIEGQPLARLWRDPEAKVAMGSATLRFATELILRGEHLNADFQPLYVTP